MVWDCLIELHSQIMNEIAFQGQTSVAVLTPLDHVICHAKRAQGLGGACASAENAGDAYCSMDHLKSGMPSRSAAVGNITKAHNPRKSQAARRTIFWRLPLAEDGRSSAQAGRPIQAWPSEHHLLCQLASVRTPCKASQNVGTEVTINIHESRVYASIDLFHVIINCLSNRSAIQEYENKGDFRAPPQKAYPQKDDLSSPAE